MLRKAFSFSSKKPPLRGRYDSSCNSTENNKKTSERFEKSEQGGSSECNFRYGAAAMQGFRSYMQDDFSCSPSESIKGEYLGFFAVFDGHGNYGHMVSKYCADNFLSCLLERKILRTARKISSGIFTPALTKTFLKFDSQLREAAMRHRPSLPGEKNINFIFSGTTGTTALVLKDSFVIANVGDSRTILCRNGSVYFSTTDHNPGIKVENDRITAAGGKLHTTPSKHTVIFDPEAYTNLAVSRTLGDFAFKNSPKLPAEEQIVSPYPDVTEIKRDHKTDEFLLLASDGVFKSMSSDEAVTFVHKQLKISDDLTKICHNLIEMAYYSPNCAPDDTTVILVVFPAAPSVTQRTINEEEAIMKEGLEILTAKIRKMVYDAEEEWVLNNEFNIIQQLVRDLPRKYCIQLRTEFIKQTLSDVRGERFGVNLEHPDSTEVETESNKEDVDPNIFIPESLTSIHMKTQNKFTSNNTESEDSHTNDEGKDEDVGYHGEIEHRDVDNGGCETMDAGGLDKTQNTSQISQNFQECTENKIIV